MLKRREKGIVAQKAKEIEKQVSKSKGKPDEQILQSAIHSLSAFNNIVGGAQAVKKADFSYLRIYEFVITRGEGQTNTYVAFIFSSLNYEVFRFMIEAAQHKNITGLMGVAEGCVIAKKYKF